MSKLKRVNTLSEKDVHTKKTKKKVAKTDIVQEISQKSSDEALESAEAHAEIEKREEAKKTEKKAKEKTPKAAKRPMTELQRRLLVIAIFAFSFFCAVFLLQFLGKYARGREIADFREKIQARLEETAYKNSVVGDFVRLSDFATNSVLAFRLDAKSGEKPAFVSVSRAWTQFGQIMLLFVTKQDGENFETSFLANLSPSDYAAETVAVRRNCKKVNDALQNSGYVQ